LKIQQHMPGSSLVIEALARRGVRTIFSLSGNQIMPLYDACIDAGIRIVHVRHEAAAVFMADAWAQVTGEIGVALVTAGPGVANAVGPLFSALQAESPVLLLSGDSAIAEDGNGAFQEIDQVAVTKPLTKLSVRASPADDLGGLVASALATALAPRRGPVHVALPFDLLTSVSASTAPAANEQASAVGTEPMPMPVPVPVPVPVREADVERIRDLVARAERPVILVGPSGCRDGARQAWQAIAERLQAPVLFMESPRGLRDPSLGAVAGEIARADLVVFAGKRLDFTIGFGKGNVFGAGASFVAIDPDAAMLERARRLLGDRLVCECLGDPAAVFANMRQAPAVRPGWMHAVASAVASRAQAGTAPASPASPASIGSRQLCEAVQRQLAGAGETIVVCDGGEFGQWAQAFCVAPVRIINGTSGAIGGGLCFAIAAKIARPGATVVALMGDGSCGFHFMEFDTAVREKAPFVAVIGNDLRWNAEHLIQLREYGEGRLLGCTLSETARYDEAAKALGGFGALVEEPAQIEAALRDAAASGRPACVNVLIDSQPAPVFARAAAPTH
jgi:acetolactate synthase-1/2/3 large subunit